MSNNAALSRRRGNANAKSANQDSALLNKEFKASEYLVKNNVHVGRNRSATVSIPKKRMRKIQARQHAKSNTSIKKPQKSHLSHLKSQSKLKNVQSEGNVLSENKVSRKSLSRGFTYANGLSIDKTTITSKTGTSHLLRFLGRLRNEGRITNDERGILRRAIMQGHAHTIRVLTQMNSFSLGSSADKVLTNLLEDLITQDMSVKVEMNEDVLDHKSTGNESIENNNMRTTIIDNALIHGVLYKKRMFGLLVPRYFVLVDDEFRYYDARTGKKLSDGVVHYTDVKAKGKYPHNEYVMIKDVPETKSKNCFELTVEKNKKLILKAKDREEKQLWLTAIAEWIVGGGKINRTTLFAKKKAIIGESMKKKTTTSGAFIKSKTFKVRHRKMPVSKKQSIVDYSSTLLLNSTNFERDIKTMVLATNRKDSVAKFQGELLYRDDKSDKNNHKWADAILRMNEKNIIVAVTENNSGINLKIGLDSKLKLRTSARNDFQFSLSPVNSRKTYTFLAADKVEYNSWVDTLACAIKRAGKQWSKKKRRSLILSKEIADANTSSTTSSPPTTTNEKSRSIGNNDIIEDGFTSPDTDNIKVNPEQNEKKDDKNEAVNKIRRNSNAMAFIQPEEAAQTIRSVGHNRRRLGGKKATKSWARVRNHVNSKKLSRAMTTLSRSSTIASSRGSRAKSSESNNLPDVTISPTIEENNVDENESKDNDLYRRIRARSRRHSTNTVGIYQGKKLDFDRLHAERKKGREAFATFSGIKEFNSLWDGLYDNDNDETEMEEDMLSFEQRILSVSVKNKFKNEAHKVMLKNAIQALKKSTASASKLSSSLFNRIDRYGIDQLVNEMFLVDVPANSTVIEKGAAGELFYIVEAGRFIPSAEDVDTFISSLTSQEKKTEKKSNLGRSPQIVVRSKRHSAIASSFRIRGSKSRQQIGAGPGDCFGHEALFHEAPRSSTVSTGNLPGMLWVLSKHQFQDVARQSMKRKGVLKRRVMRFVPLLKRFLEQSEIKALSKCAEDEVARPDEFLVYRKRPEKLFIILRGVVEVTEKNVDTGDEKVFHATVTEYVGLESLLNQDETFVRNNNVVLTVKALKNPVHYMTITLDDIEEVITSKERLNSFIEHMKEKYYETKRTLVQKSSDLRRNTIVSIAKEKSSRTLQTYSSSIKSDSFKKPTRSRRFSMQVQPGPFRMKRRSILIVKKDSKQEIQSSVKKDSENVNLIDSREDTSAEANVGNTSPKRQIRRRRRSNFIKQPNTAIISTFTLPDDESGTDTNSGRDINSPSINLDRISSANKVTDNNNNDADDDIVSIPSKSNVSQSPPSSPNTSAKEGDNSKSILPLETRMTTNTSPGLDENGRISLDDMTAEDTDSADESDDDYDNKDLPWDDGAYLSPAIKIEDLTVHKTLGHGAFSKVKLVSAKYDFFALKCMERAYIVDNDCQEMVDNELAALKELNGSSEFVMGLHGAFTTEKMVFFLTELCPGGELYNHIRDRENGFYLEKDALFYGACVIEGLKAIHEKKIVYRDLKMENLIIDEVGYIKIVDFGLAKKTEKTFTSCGTPEYMSPEMILSSGHNFCSDYWAFGILMFELVNGSTPFVGMEVMETYENILDHKASHKLPFQNSVIVSRTYKRLVRALLKKRPSRRLGNKGIEEIFKHHLFENFEFGPLRERQLEAPFLPSMDTSGNAEGGGAEEEGGHLVLLDVDWEDVSRDKSGWVPNI